VQTVKADTKLNNGISNPLESETKLSSSEPDLGRVDGKRLRRKLHKAVEGSALT
jgi:hypothetical protein